MLAQLISILRSVVLIFWSLVVMYSWEPSWRTVRHRGDSGDHKEAVLFGSGIMAVAFQVHAFWSPHGDTGTAFLLAGFAIPPLMAARLIYLPRTPEPHRRAAVLTFLAITVACVVGGSLG